MQFFYNDIHSGMVVAMTTKTKKKVLVIYTLHCSHSLLGTFVLSLSSTALRIAHGWLYLPEL